MTLEPGQTGVLQIALGPGFPYKKDRGRTDGLPETPAYVWMLSIATDAGFRPADAGSHDTTIPRRARAAADHQVTDA